MLTPCILRLVERLHDLHHFDLIHAHFIYPDGVVAGRIGRHLDLPVVTTEHAHWIPWMSNHPATWNRVMRGLADIHTVTAVSEPVRRGIQQLVGRPIRNEVLPNVLDDVTFSIDPRETRDPNEILFVGVIRKVKGFDILVKALNILLSLRPDARVVVIGDPFFKAYRRDFLDAMRLAEDLRIADRITSVGAATPAEVARAMRRAKVVVVPSRRESFSSVTAEALACGTPVVATASGGPEEIIRSDTGVLVEPEAPEALANALHEVMSAPASRFDGRTLRNSVVERFGLEQSRRRLLDLYQRIISEDDTE